MHTTHTHDTARMRVQSVRMHGWHARMRAARQPSAAHLLDHRRQKRPAAEVDSPQVGLYDLSPAVKVGVRSALAVGLDGGIVHQKVHRAEFGIRLALDRLQLLLAPAVARDSQHICPLCAVVNRLFTNGLQLRSLNISHQHLHAEIGAAQRCGASNPGGAAYYDCYRTLGQHTCGVHGRRRGG